MVRCARFLRVLDEVADTVDGPQSIQSGQVYKITNVETGTVLDVSGEDNQTVIGYAYGGTENQHVGLLSPCFSARAIMRS